ncbi:MAG: PSD1 and planctomycete cytochrome C domain-containing protein [Rubripirellula sp.]
MRILSALLAVVMFIGVIRAADDRELEAFFEKKIRPVLVAECYECHSASSKDPQGGLLLDTREGIRRGGDNGHAVVPGELGDSLILDALRHESLEMPPEKKLSEDVIKDFAKWIRMGAFDPREGKSALIRREIDLDEAREFWSFRPIEDPTLPATKNTSWAKTEIDSFVLARLEKKGLRPVKDADSATLVRRIYFDLVGLPPTPRQVKSFEQAMKADPDAAIGNLVDELLASRHFGERWGRHWLDVVRYAESTGMERNGTFTRAWRYRDYVIESLNQDTPFDQFIREQVSGDLLPFESNQQRDRQLIATGMLAIGPKSLNETKKEKFKMDVVDEQIDVVTRSFLGVTASCARCHDHKFDPIPQSEYYALAGIFTSTDTHYGTAKTNGNRNPGKLLAIKGDQVEAAVVSGGAKGASEEKKYRNQLKSLQRKMASLKSQLARAKNDGARRTLRKRMADLTDDIRRANGRLRQATQPKQDLGDDAMLVMAVSESDRIADTKLRIRGEPDEYGQEVPRGFLTIGSDREHPAIESNGSGRDELADWIARSNHPLTSRVAVNRVWQHLFGNGIVGTVNNFGANGDRPTHPLLLDYLATRFVEDEWSLKSTIRRIMISRVYRQSSMDDTDGLAVDPDNELLWRMDQRRLEAEAIRDAMLMVSGELEFEARQGSPVEKLGEGIIGRNLRTNDLAQDDRRRSIYLPIVRGAVPEMLALFDFPEPSIVGGMRNVTTVPTQALYMMNSPGVIQYSERLAKRVSNEAPAIEQRIDLAYQLAFARSAEPVEIERAVGFFDDTVRNLTEVEKRTTDESELLALTGICQALLASAEFRYVN